MFLYALHDKEVTCRNCGLPIDTVKILDGWGSLQACDLCVDMWLAVAKSPYMIGCQGEWQAEQCRRRAMLGGE